MNMNIGQNESDYSSGDGNFAAGSDGRFAETEFGESDNGSKSSPLDIVLTRMHGRWIQAGILALILSPIFALLGFMLGPVKYTSSAQLQVIKSGLWLR